MSSDASSRSARGRWSAALAAFQSWSDEAAPEPESAAVGAPDPAYRAALEGLPDPVLIVEAGDPEDFGARRIRFANTQARGLLKAAEEGASLVAAVRDPEALEAIDEALFGQVARDVLYEGGGAQDRVWRIAASPLGETADGSPLAVVRFRDETDALRMERMRADFLANASHELKTPLASLAGFIETLKGHARDDERARDHFLDIMAAQTARMSRLIADLLSLSRIELSEHIPPSGRADAALAAADVMDALAPLLTQQGVRVEIDGPEPGAAVVTGERDQIIQVLQNLIENAVRYSPKGTAVEVSIRPGLTTSAAQAPRRPGSARLAILTPDRDAAARYVGVTITDKGQGIEREHLPRLTERFYRVEGQKSGQGSGTGLGLSIVKHIVNRHRGGLIVESRVGEGSAFTVYLPGVTKAGA